MAVCGKGFPLKKWFSNKCAEGCLPLFAAMYAYTVMQNVLLYLCISSSLWYVPAGAANIILDILAQMQQKHNDNRDSCDRMALLIVGKPQTGRQTPKSCIVSDDLCYVHSLLTQFMPCWASKIKRWRRLEGAAYLWHVVHRCCMSLACGYRKDYAAERHCKHNG